MNIPLNDLLKIALALASSLVVCFAMTPLVRSFAVKVGAVDVPRDNRRMHDHPIPRQGGLAIFLGFLVGVVLFADLDRQVQGILLGSVIIVTVGAIDDIVPLPALLKFVIQIAAAGVAVAFGVRLEFIANPLFWSDSQFIYFGAWSIPVTIFWIVGITNSINLIDGLDGLACGVSAISSLTFLVISLVIPGQVNVAVLLAAILGACMGFIPYNINPAKIFMGDTGALLLGYLLSTISVIGLFKFYAVISFTVPLLALALPIFDTCFAIIRRLLKGQNPMSPDRGHFHHRLIDMGLSQKQSVAVLYSISAVLGLSAVLIATSGAMKALILVFSFCVAIIIGIVLLKSWDDRHEKAGEENTEKLPETEVKELTDETPESKPEGLPDSTESTENNTEKKDGD